MTHYCFSGQKFSSLGIIPIHGRASTLTLIADLSEFSVASHRTRKLH